MNKGDRIRQARENCGLTQEELAKKLNTTKQTIHKYETGLISNIPSDKIELLARIFGISPSYLMGWDKEKNNTFNTPTYVIGENGEREVRYQESEPNSNRATLLAEMGIKPNSNYLISKNNKKTELSDNEYDFLINSLEFFRKK